MTRVQQPVPGVTVLDDFLSHESFLAAARASQFFTYASPHERHWSKAYGLDGVTLQTGLVLRGAKSDTPAGLDALGQVVDRIRQTQQVSELFEAAQPRDILVSGRVVLMSEGAGIGWHRDSANLLGAYVYYVHPTWRSNWGGDLMIANVEDRDAHDLQTEGQQTSAEGEIGPDFDFGGVEARLTSTGIGTYVCPKPNRLVLLSPQVMHRVSPVARAAGDAVRCAVTGFFLPLSRTAN